MGEQLSPHWATSAHNIYHYFLWGPVCMERGRLLIRNPDDFQRSRTTDLPKLTACTWNSNPYATPQIKNTGNVMWTVTRLCRASPNLVQVTLMWVWYANKTWSYTCLTTCAFTQTASAGFQHWHNKLQTHGAILSLVSLFISSTKLEAPGSYHAYSGLFWSARFETADGTSYSSAPATAVQLGCSWYLLQSVKNVIMCYV